MPIEPQCPTTPFDDRDCPSLQQTRAHHDRATTTSVTATIRRGRAQGRRGAQVRSCVRTTRPCAALWRERSIPVPTPGMVRPKPSSPNCRLAATTPCIHSSSMPRAQSSWMSLPPPIHASRKTGNLKYRVQTPAPNLRLAASGVMTLTRLTRRFHHTSPFARPNGLSSRNCPCSIGRKEVGPPNVHEVKALSPHHRPVIALHSPDGLAETVLGLCPPEKTARKLACGIRQDTFSSAVWRQDLQNCGDFQRFLQ